MSIGWKDDKLSTEETTQSVDKVRNTVDDLSEVSRNQKKQQESSVENSTASKTNVKNFIVIIVIVIFLICAGVLLQMQQSNNVATSEQESEIGNVTETVADMSEFTGTENFIESNNSEEINENVVYDSRGNVISENGIYDKDGNIISSEEDVIKTGLPDFKDSTNNKTTATVYSDSDFIKDLNGVDVPAVYNVKSRDYIKDFVNYEAKRAIIDDGMELYWLEVIYNSRRYRVQVPFYVFKDLDKTGICIVELEVLTLEGGEKIISYMQVITDYSNLGK